MSHSHPVLFKTNTTQIGGSSAVMWDYLQMSINPNDYLCVFTAVREMCFNTTTGFSLLIKSITKNLFNRQTKGFVMRPGRLVFSQTRLRCRTRDT